jgi:rod shape-determining protein MreC
MESVLGRYRNLTILVGVLFLQVLGLAVQVKRSGDAQNTRLIRIWAVDAITPFERVFVNAQNYASGLWHDYVSLRGLRAENLELKETIQKMQLRQVRLSEDAAQAQRLQSLLSFKEQIIEHTVAAQVIGSSGSDLSRSIYLDKGSNDGIGQDMAVITANGVVGKVLRVYPSTSLVLLINDQSSGVGALLEKSRLQGVVRGTANGELSLDHVMSDEQVSPGETVLSSGGDQIFPKGLPVGTVTRVSPDKEMFLNIKVKPTADLNRLEEVLVVTEKREEQPVAKGGGKVRAADILAQRLPSVPEKPATVANTTAASTTPAEPGAKAPGEVSSANPSTGSAPKVLAGSAPRPTATTGGKNIAATGMNSGSSTAAALPKSAPASKPAQNTASPSFAATDNGTGANSGNASVKPSTVLSKPATPTPVVQSPDSQDSPH